jgi:hypothetical protein
MEAKMKKKAERGMNRYTPFPLPANIDGYLV